MESNRLKITDLNGHEIEVTDLNRAIGIAGRHSQYRHRDRSYSELDRRLQAYWTDMHEKLLVLQLRREQETIKP